MQRSPYHMKKNKPQVIHRIGHCAICGWVHSEIRRVRVSEGEKAVIKALCVKCIKEQPVHVLCDLCGRTKCDNLYPVTIMKKSLDDGQSCNIFIHLCAECRKIPHNEVLSRLNVPTDLCDSCKDRFSCFTSKGEKPSPSSEHSGTLEGKPTKLHKRVDLGRFLRGVLR